MNNRYDLYVGRKFGRLTIANIVGNRKNGIVVECDCECGQRCLKLIKHILSGASKSCGCLNKELVSKKFKTHGLSKHPIRKIHNAMMSRCYNVSSKSYKDYGGRGIRVFDEWHLFINFYNDMVVGYSAGLEIDRIDVNGDYRKENCRWATRHQQQRNRRDNVFITIDGKTNIMSDWAKISGVKKATIWFRLKMGWPPTEAVFCPTKNRRSI